MKQLSGLDAAFLYLESPRTPMHVGGVYLFNAANTQNFGFQAFRAHIASRLDSARTLRQRLVAVPLSLDHPYWAVDPDFVLDAHLSHQVLPRPRDWRALMTLAEGIFAQPLARERPLWAITFVEGLDRIEGLASGSFAMIVKVHHAAVDGVSGEEMIWALLDRQPRPDRRRRTKPCQPERLPSRAELLARAFAKTIMQPLQLAKLGGRLASAAVAVAKQKTLYHTPFPPLPLEAPFTRFNASVTAQRIFRAIQLPLSRVQAVRRLTEGATVNDVVLATCAGGLRRYLEVRQELPEKPLVALVPISLRPRRHWRDMGNRVSAMPVSLATDISDPLQRFRSIHASVLVSRRYIELMGPEQFADWVPSTAAALIGRLYCRLSVPQYLGPFFSLFITNVPGPQKPLFLGGAPMLSHMGMAPIFDGLGLILVVTSYLDTLVISATSCPEMMPDAEVFMADLREAFMELEERVSTVR